MDLDNKDNIEIDDQILNDTDNIETRDEIISDTDEEIIDGEGNIVTGEEFIDGTNNTEINEEIIDGEGNIVTDEEIINNAGDLETDNKVMDNKNKKNNNTNTRSSKHKIYVSYSMRLGIATAIFVVFLLISIFLVNKTFSYSESRVINYSERKALDYKVYLKPNTFYDDQYLNKDMIYVANLIDTINVDFDYNFNIDEPYSINFTYQILGELVIEDPSTNATFLKKEYALSTEKSQQLENNNTLNIKETINIDYDHYNDITNAYKAKYGVETNSYLKVYLKVTKNCTDDDVISLNDSEDTAVKIPLSERAVEILLDSQEGDSNHQAITNAKLTFDVYAAIVGAISTLIAMISLIKVIKLLTFALEKHNKYDKYIKKILREYDRLIVETSTDYDSRDHNVIRVASFEELLDVRDNLKLPIMYYNVSNHSKCHFYIMNKNDIYLITIKEADLE